MIWLEWGRLFSPGRIQQTSSKARWRQIERKMIKQQNLTQSDCKLKISREMQKTQWHLKYIYGTLCQTEWMYSFLITFSLNTTELYWIGAQVYLISAACKAIEMELKEKIAHYEFQCRQLGWGQQECFCNWQRSEPGDYHKQFTWHWFNLLDGVIEPGLSKHSPRLDH